MSLKFKRALYLEPSAKTLGRHLAEADLEVLPEKIRKKIHLSSIEAWLKRKCQDITKDELAAVMASYKATLEKAKIL